MNDITILPTRAGDLDRKTYLGSSDIAAIMGLSPWATPLDVYLHKIGEHPDPITPEKEKLFRRGKRLEPIVLEMLADEYPIQITRRSLPNSPNRYIDTDVPYFAAEIDFEFMITDALAAAFPQLLPFVGTEQNGEIKTVHPFAAKKWGEAETDEVPIEYAAQTMFGLGVRRRDVCLVVALFGADNLQVYCVERDDETISGIYRKGIDFWTNHVLARVPPDPINWDDMMRLFARINGRPVELDDATARLLANYRDAAQREKAWKDRREELRFQIADYIRRQWGADSVEEMTDNARLLIGGEQVASWNKQSATRIDAEVLRAEEPDIAAKYSKTSWTRVLRLKKGK